MRLLFGLRICPGPPGGRAGPRPGPQGPGLPPGSVPAGLGRRPTAGQTQAIALLQQDYTVIPRQQGFRAAPSHCPGHSVAPSVSEAALAVPDPGPVWITRCSSDAPLYKSIIIKLLCLYFQVLGDVFLSSSEQRWVTAVVAKGSNFESGPNIIRSPSINKIEMDVSSTFRRKALAKIPFSSVFYCSQPLAAALTRKRTLIFFFALAVIGNLTEFWPAQVFEDLSAQKSQQIRFNVFERRGIHISASTRCPFGPSIASLGITSNGKPISFPNKSTASESSITMSFDPPVEWNGWFFVTDHRSPECDPVKFSLETFDGSKWKTVGSSMSMQVTKETVFLHGYFQTSKERGVRHDFDILAPSFFGYFAVRFLGDGQGIGIALCGFLGRERLGAQLPNVQAFLFVVSMLIASCFTDPSKGDYSAIPHLYFGLMQGGALYFQLRNQWLLTTFWISSFLIMLGAALAPYAPEPALHVVSVGVPWFAAVTAVRAFSWWTTRAARRSVAGDQRFYDALWALILDDPESRAAADAFEDLLAGEARRRLPSPPAVSWDLVFSHVRQALPRRQDSGLAALLDGRSHGVLADLETLYRQAQAVYWPFQRKVLALAAATGAFLPVAPGSVIGRGEGRGRDPSGVAAWGHGLAGRATAGLRGKSRAATATIVWFARVRRAPDWALAGLGRSRPRGPASREGDVRPAVNKSLTV